MKTYFFILIAIIAAVSLTACTTPQGDEVAVNYYGNINTSNDSTELNGDLLTERSAGDQDKFDDVTVYFVGENGSILAEERLGDINATYGSLNVSVSSGVRPHYIVFNSDDFWDEKVDVQYWEYVDGQFVTRRTASRSGLPGFD